MADNIIINATINHIRVIVTNPINTSSSITVLLVFAFVFMVWVSNIPVDDEDGSAIFSHSCICTVEESFSIRYVILLYRVCISDNKFSIMTSIGRG